MAGIYERITNADETGETKIPVHSFMAYLREWARGNVTKADVVEGFSLDATAEFEIDAIATGHNNLSGEDARLNYRTQIHDAFLLAEAGLYTKTKVKDVLGF